MCVELTAKHKFGEPWIVIEGYSVNATAYCGGGDSITIPKEKVSRIVACVNCLAGVPSHWLDSPLLKEFISSINWECGNATLHGAPITMTLVEFCASVLSHTEQYGDAIAKAKS